MSMKALRDALASAKRDDFEVGTVIRWVAADRYNYAAIKTPVGWYTTATNRAAMYVGQVEDFDGLIEALSRSEVSNVEVAAVWEQVFPEREASEVSTEEGHRYTYPPSTL